MRDSLPYPDADPRSDLPAPQKSFDPAGLQDLVGLGEMNEFIDLFSTQMSARLPELADAIARDDPAAVDEIAHSLKGSAATIGTPRVMQICDAICTVAKHGTCVGAPELHAELIAAWSDAAAAIAGYLEATRR